MEKWRTSTPAPKSARLKSIRPLILRWMLAVGSFVAVLGRAEDIGDISASASAIYSGPTSHGYAETRVLLVNRSPVREYTVTLTTPEEFSGGSGNSLGCIRRTLKVPPGARVVASLLQPPLPIAGPAMIRVAVAGVGSANIRQPSGNRHMQIFPRQVTMFVSRSLDGEAMSRGINSGRTGFTAEQAVGKPNNSESYGLPPAAWTPDTTRIGTTNWLELDYASPQAVESVSIYFARRAVTTGSMQLIGVSGTNMMPALPLKSGTNVWNNSSHVLKMTFPRTREPVKTVRLDFGTTMPMDISVDAVEISDASISQCASAARASSDNSASPPVSSGGDGDFVATLRAESGFSDWSENWLAYTPFDLIALSATDLDGMPAPVFDAIGCYLRAGGNIVILGARELPKGWSASAKTPSTDMTECECGLGRCFLLATSNPAAVRDDIFRHLRAASLASSSYWQWLPADASTANKALPVVEDVKIPARGIIMAMLGFIFVIGPVNIYVLSRKQRRTWMLWTIPTISFVTTLLVFIYTLLREGVTPDTRIGGLTVLDQSAKQAVTVGAMGVYCPLTPSAGLKFEAQTEATPLCSRGFNHAGGAREVDWTQTQHFTLGWVVSRVPAHFHVRKSGTCRERLQIINEDGNLTVINGLGAPVKSLLLADKDMHVYKAVDIRPGQKASLQLTHEPQAALKLGARKLLQEITYTGRTDRVGSVEQKFLQPGTYVALLDGNPFIENALGAAASARRTKSSAVVFGILENPEAK